MNGSSNFLPLALAFALLINVESRRPADEERDALGDLGEHEREALAGALIEIVKIFGTHPLYVSPPCPGHTPTRLGHTPSFLVFFMLVPLLRKAL